MNPSTAFGLSFTDELIRCGLREVVLAPGSRSTPLAMAFLDAERQHRIRLHVRIDERSASFTALGLAKASRRPVAVLCTSGTAAANFHPAVIEADESGVPLLVLTADRPPEMRGTGANQVIDQVKLYGSAVRWFCDAGVPEARPGMAGYWRSLACQAWAHASGQAGGLACPVHLNLAFREPLVPGDPGEPTWPEPLEGRPDGRPWTSFERPGPSPDELEVPWTERGVVVCGDGDYDAAALVALAERAGWPVLAEPSSGARRGPNALAAYQYLLATPEFMTAHQPDLIVSAGLPGFPARRLPCSPPRRAAGTWSSRRGQDAGPTRSGPRPTWPQRSGSPPRPVCPAARAIPAARANPAARAIPLRRRLRRRRRIRRRGRTRAARAARANPAAPATRAARANPAAPANRRRGRIPLRRRTGWHVGVRLAGGLATGGPCGPVCCGCGDRWRRQPDRAAAGPGSRPPRAGRGLGLDGFKPARSGY